MQTRRIVGREYLVTPWTAGAAVGAGSGRRGVPRAGAAPVRSERAETDSAGRAALGSDIGPTGSVPVGRQAVFQDESSRLGNLAGSFLSECTFPNVPGRLPDVGVRVHERRRATRRNSISGPTLKPDPEDIKLLASETFDD